MSAYLILAAAVGLFLPAGLCGQTVYFRCSDPPNKCIEKTEPEEADCPECKAWIKVFLDFKTIMETARVEQKEAGVDLPHIASNFFIDAAGEKIYGLDIGVETLPKTGDISRNPGKYGLRRLRTNESKGGSLVIVGDVAGVATEKDGKLKIAYPSAKAGEVRLAIPSVLASSEKAKVYYFVPLKKK